MKFIHAADLHLDSPFEGLRQLPEPVWQLIYQAPFKATQQLVDQAIDQEVAFVLLAGDLFDRETQSVAAQLFLNEQLQRLIDAQIGVYLCFGNHDYQTANQAIDLPEGVHVFVSTVSTMTLTTRNQKRVAISGFSYPTRWLETDMAAQFPVRGDVDYHIGMLHGALRQSGTNHYAPFTLDELRETHYDYWALGHIHKPEVLQEQPPIVYAGTIQGRHKNEAGEHGYTLVRSQDTRLVPSFVPVNPVDWVTLAITVTDQQSETELIDLVFEQLSRLTDETTFKLVSLTLTNVEALPGQVVAQLNNGNWFDRLSQLQEDQYEANRCWIYETHSQPAATDIHYSQLDAEFWKAAQADVFTGDELTKAAGKKLLSYPFLADHLLASTTLEDTQERAENELLQQARLEADDHAD
ncbi:hypothetical protein AYR62_07250 [Secundilactobacillus paracollinoides]|uniref:Calcineurin-like phosphoesterase domain-containing protein n=2 Tax=Secundilactobacillus paracollinoides TaxID=240427 RepID=A0A1B2J1G7_9LACO|nr:DNA repair exonuclease [Secundilactobacillus paracollinoides]ANZ62218.1 hypothetical protein AYR61_13265 [Secundilactobacillus paracollinoides]ANZ63906.1 hypothetical protein AYR62_07250 [Secundilactobacillus paracollinoides]ANZ68165.1 hypothetical protein AYR63_14140 [Secundilactobacillus paracollinoides]